MHNTSRQLYKYIANLIVDFFQSQKIAPGDRFNLYLEEISHVEGLYAALRNENDTKPFSFTHPDGDGEYNTYTINIDDTAVIVSSSANASEDYFTMLRNQVADQQGIFELKAILILFSGKLDSLLGGSGSLIKEGMPLHYQSFKQRLEKDIVSSSFDNHEKLILSQVLYRKTKSVVEDNNSIFDYAQVIECLVNEEINTENYNSLGLFPHEELSSISEAKTQKQLLQLNFDLFEKMENMHLHGNPEVELERIVSERGRQELTKSDWGSNDFNQVNDWKEAKETKVAPKFQEVLGSDAFRTIWSRPDGSGEAGKRSNNLIVFNPHQEYPYELELKFDEFIRKEGVEVRKGKDHIKPSCSGYSLKLEIDGKDEASPFSIVLYRDPDSGKLYKFKILQVHSEEALFKQFENSYLISNKANPHLMLDEAEELVFNYGVGNAVSESLEIERSYRVIPDNELKLHVDYAAITEDVVPFKIDVEGTEIDIAIKPESEPPKPIQGIDVWKNKREFATNFRFEQTEETLKLLFRNNERTVRGRFRKNLLLESHMINSDHFSWMEYSDQELRPHELHLSDRLKNAFNALRIEYRDCKDEILPSLVYLKDDFKTLAENYVSVFLEELIEIQENSPLSLQKKGLMWLGVVQERYGEGLIKHSPLHPLNVAYQLYLNDRLKGEKVYDAILKRLNPMNLVPFLENKGKVYTPVDSNDSPEWICYTEYLESEQAVPKSYVTKLITDKIVDFTHNFNFLFSQSSYSPIIINVINLGDCREVVQGIFEYYRTFLNKHKTHRPDELLPIDVNIYGSQKLVTKFEELTFYDRVEDVEEHIEVKLKTSNFEKEDLLNAFLEKVKFFSKPFPKEQEEYEYAHITFYQFDRNKIKRNTNKTSDIKSGISMDGLMADVPSVPIGQTYRSGFGIKYIEDNRPKLVKVADLYNALVNVADSGENFERNKAICSAIDFEVKAQLEKLYSNSQWVTYIDPKVDLDFFKEKEDLVIIHYSDQYNNSSGYDAITVSSKTDQYSFIVGEFLEKNHVQYSDKEDTLKVINFFNAINGDWLLKLIRQDSQFPREKISLLSGIKSALTFLYHPNITWVPVSLEEILRISGSAGLKMAEGPFSATNLGYDDLSYSDDLLMIGLENRQGRLKMHLFPMELKIGGSNLVKKGLEQGERTAKLLRLHLTKIDFFGEFNRNFFGKLALTGAEKMHLYKIWEGQDWVKVINEYRGDLLNNNFDIATELDEKYGKFGLLIFQSGNAKRELKRENDYVLGVLLESDGYNFLIKSIDELIQLFHETQTSIKKENLLISCLNADQLESSSFKSTHVSAPEEVETAPTPLLEEVEEIKTAPKSNQANVNGIEVLFGTNLNDGSKVVWEPNNTDKVMHTNTGIIGTMGTGKTQFTKSLIAQLTWNAEHNIGDEPLGILIFDYKGDYIKEDFVKSTNAKVYDPYHLPYNPLALDGTPQSKPMLPLHTANDIKETISNAFNLGNIQKQRLRDAIVEAYETKGIYKGKRDTWTIPAPTIQDVCDIFMSGENVAQDSLYAAISNLQDFEIFEPSVKKTKSLYDLIDGVVVINLSGYDESIQNLIVAITLDAFYTQMQTNGHSQIEKLEDGRLLRQVKKMILVDEADNFLSKNFNSIKKILKEGREFGVGTVLSTQFLNHFSTGENDYSNYILTWVIHRVNEIKTKEVESLFTIESRDQRDNLFKTIKSLEKHHSIVNLAGSGPVYTKDKAFWEFLN